MILSARSRIWLRECFWKDYAWQIWDFLLFGIVNSSRKRNIMTFINSMNNYFVTSSPWYLTRFNSQQNRFKCPKNNAILIPLILEKVPKVGGDTLHPLGCFAPSHGTPITPPPPPQSWKQIDSYDKTRVCNRIRDGEKGNLFRQRLTWHDPSLADSRLVANTSR